MMICCCSLPLTDLRLYVWTIGGRGLKADRRRGASDREERMDSCCCSPNLHAATVAAALFTREQ